VIDVDDLPEAQPSDPAKRLARLNQLAKMEKALKEQEEKGKPKPKKKQVQFNSIFTDNRILY
jgi:hypothetical protein